MDFTMNAGARLQFNHATDMEITQHLAAHHDTGDFDIALYTATAGNKKVTGIGRLCFDIAPYPAIYPQTTTKLQIAFYCAGASNNAVDKIVLFFIRHESPLELCCRQRNFACAMLWHWRIPDLA